MASRKVNSIVVEIGADTVKFRDAMKPVNTSLKQLQTEMKTTVNEAKAYGNSTQQLEKMHDNLTRQIEEQQRALDIIAQAHEKASLETEKDADAVSRLELEMERARGKLAELQAQLVKNEAQQFARQVQDLNNEISQLDVTIESARDDNQKYGATQERLATISEGLTDKLGIQREMIERTRTELARAEERYGANSDQVTALSKSLDTAERAQTSLNKELEEANKKLEVSKGAWGELYTELDMVRARVDETGGAFDRVTRKAQILSAAVLAIAAASAKAFLDFSKESAKLTTLLDEDILSYEQAQQEILRISDATGQSAGDLANAMYNALSASVATADVTKFLEVSAKTAVAGFTDTATAVDILSSIINSYGMSARDAEDIANKLILTQDKGKTTVGELANGFGDLSSIAKEAGIPLEEILAAIAAITASGVSTDKAITGLRATISSIINPTEKATKKAQEMGLRFDAMALQSKGLAGFLESVERKAHGNIGTMGELFGSVKALGDVLTLTGAGAEKFDEALQLMGDSTGKMAENFDKVTNVEGVKFQNALNEIANAAVRLGDALSPILNVIAFILSVLAQIPAPVLMIIGVIVLAITTLLTVMNTIKSVTGAVGDVQKAWGAASGALQESKWIRIAAIIMGVVAAAALLLFLILALKENTNSAVQAIDSGMESISGTVSKAQSSATPGGKAYARGTRYASGGEALVGEQGPERVILPRGSRVYTAADTKQMSPGGDTLIFENVTLDVSSAKDVTQLMELFRKLKQTHRAGGRGR